MLWRLLEYVKPYWRRITALIVVSIILSLLNVAEPALMGQLTAAIFGGGRGLTISASFDGGGGPAEAQFIFVKENGTFTPAERELIQSLSREKMGSYASLNWRERDGELQLTLAARNRSALQNLHYPELAAVFQRAVPGVAFYSRAMAETKTSLTIFPEIPTIYLLPSLLLLVMFVRIFFHFGQVYFGNYVTTGAVRDMRNGLYAHLQRLSLGFFERQETGVLMSRVSNDAGTLQNFLHVIFTNLLGEFLTILAGVVYAFIIDWQLAAVTILVMSLIAWPISALGQQLRKTGHRIQERSAKLNGVMQENLSGMRVLQAFQLEGLAQQKFNAQSEQVFRAGMRAARVMGFLSPFVEFLAGLALAAFIWYGAYRMGIGQLAADQLFTFIFVIGYIANPIKHLSKMYGQVQHALAAGQRVLEFMDLEPQIKEAPGAVALPPLRGEVRFERVSFAYGDGPEVLKEIDLTVEPGEILALVGPSGAGKTSLVNLLPRFYDPLRGRVLLDGYDLRSVTLASLRSQLGIVPQETVLFRTTVAENIGHGRPGASRAEIEEAARLANAHEFITELPEGYDTLVGERGQTLSGGQRQRIAIARAILRDPRVLILDEATSSLDSASEAQVQEALDRLMHGRTTFVIAHRLSTVRRAHRLAVIKDGRLEEMGTHQELLAMDGVYAQLYRQQFDEVR